MSIYWYPASRILSTLCLSAELSWDWFWWQSSSCHKCLLASYQLVIIQMSKRVKIHENFSFLSKSDWLLAEVECIIFSRVAQIKPDNSPSKKSNLLLVFIIGISPQAKVNFPALTLNSSKTQRNFQGWANLSIMHLLIVRCLQLLWCTKCLISTTKCDFPIVWQVCQYLSY